jgi:ParB family transcriptional regulator, chromosome partitioning protein
MSRKDTLRALLTAKERRLPDGNSADTDMVEATSFADAPKQLVRSGAVGAMGRSLGKLANAAEEARALIAAGEAVVEIDPGLIESSFITDRLGEPSEEHTALVASIREHGQQVPVLVRPHPEKPGRYQVAYGHRRLRAAIEIGRPLRAVVRELSDSELVVAQGQENSARLELSYIERAMFAVSIENRGFERDVIMAALSVEKTQLSRLISIGRSIPLKIVQLIGPAPKTGRPRWSLLAEKLASQDVDPIITRLTDDQAFVVADSDARFAFFLAALDAKPRNNAEKETWRNDEGRQIATCQRATGRTTFVVDERAAPDFGEFLLKELPRLYRDYREGRESVRGGGS